MKRIELGNDYVIDITRAGECSKNYNLKTNVRTNVKKDGTEYEVSESRGHHSSVGACIEAMFDELVYKRLEKRQSIERTVEILEEVKKECEEINKKFNI